MPTRRPNSLTGLFNDFVGGLALVGMAIGAAIIGLIWGGAALVSAVTDDNVIGVKLSDAQMDMRKKGKICDEFLTQAFTLAKQQNKTVDLKLPPKPEQNCPKP